MVWILLGIDYMARRTVVKFSKTVRMEKDGNLLKVGDKWYRFVTNVDGDFRTGEYLLEEVDKNKIDKQIETIVEKLFKFIEPKLVLEDALKDLDEKELYKLYKFVLKKGRQLKPKVQKHCINMKVGGVDIPIR